MQLENLTYALTQVVHNFGALAVGGGAIVGLRAKYSQTSLRNTMALIVMIAWGTQAASGLIFGGISLWTYGETPDLHDTALVALFIKMFCAVSGFGLALLYLRKAKNWNEKACHRLWHALAGLGAIALTSAAFLRWFS